MRSVTAPGLEQLAIAGLPVVSVGRSFGANKPWLCSRHRTTECVHDLAQRPPDMRRADAPEERFPALGVLVIAKSAADMLHESQIAVGGLVAGVPASHRPHSADKSGPSRPRAAVDVHARSLGH